MVPKRRHEKSDAGDTPKRLLTISKTRWKFEINNISVYFNIRNTLPKFGIFLLGHSVYVCGSSRSYAPDTLLPVDNTTNTNTVHVAQPFCTQWRQQLCADRYAEVNPTVERRSHPYTTTAVHKLPAFTCHFPTLLRHVSGRSTGVLRCTVGSGNRQLSGREMSLIWSHDGVQLQHTFYPFAV
jgi:hypothetical protein